ncbi:GNAT family N-acetyltransferase [Frankia sp. EI5c]|uniref:GNAT family N-acetyltransferase n=1 Tax=Frankia sp. EI5c TaxID=683316 RepID=UPI001A7E5FBE|nr:GNAT family N-acetyltransferase [Frankia sp. EI5c]
MGPRAGVAASAVGVASAAGVASVVGVASAAGVVRAARESDIEAMRFVEQAAGQLFLQVGMPEVAADPPFAPDVLLGYVRRGQAWVSPAAGLGAGGTGGGPDPGDPVGYALVDLMAGSLHLEQLSVRPDHGRCGRGAALFAAVCGQARLLGYPRVTLSTFRDVPWNAPLYARWGAQPLAAAEIDVELAAVVERERAHGLDPSGRLLMAVDLPGRAPAGPA